MEQKMKLPLKSFLPEEVTETEILKNTKNSTRIASILGTWTGQTHLKTDIGSYELMAYFVIHFMPDPMRGYGCSLPDCHERQNQICSLDEDYNPVCGTMEDGTIVDWSDVVAFMYFGAKVDVGFPFNKHRAEDTGGWVGPMNMVMAQNETLVLDLMGQSQRREVTKKGSGDGSDSKTVDQYMSRYVETPSTSFLKMPKDCTLINKEDFEKSMGQSAVRSTVEAQYKKDSDDEDNEGGNDDPYYPYLRTCSNGNVKPILPLFWFDFVEDEKTKEESLEVRFKYKLMTMPKKRDYMYNIYPMVQKRFNNADLGFHISGPYCYGDDPARGYTFDMNFDSKDPKKMIQLEHGCIDGLPCLPPAAELGSTGSSIDVHPNSPGTTIAVGKSIYFIILFSILSLSILVSVVNNFRLRRQLANLRSSENYGDSGMRELESETAAAETPEADGYEALEEEGGGHGESENDGCDGHDLSTPLLETSNPEVADV